MSALNGVGFRFVEYLNHYLYSRCLNFNYIFRTTEIIILCMRFRAKLPVIDQLFLNKIYKLRRAAVRKNVDDRKNPKIFRTSRYPLRHGQFVRLFLQLSSGFCSRTSRRWTHTKRNGDKTDDRRHDIGKNTTGKCQKFSHRIVCWHEIKKKKRLTWGNTRSFAGIKRKEKLYVVINLKKKFSLI